MREIQAFRYFWPGYQMQNLKRLKKLKQRASLLKADGCVYRPDECRDARRTASC
jgi:hypothetical protein